MNPDEPNAEEKLQKLHQDGPTPFQPADPNPATTGNTTDPVVEEASSTELPDDHPATDDKLDETELYNEGRSGATEVIDTTNQSAVIGLVNDDGEDQDDDSTAL